MRHQTTIYGYNFHSKDKAIQNIKNIFPIYNEIKLPAKKSDLMRELDTRFNAADKLIDIFMTLISSYFSSLNVQQRSAVHTFSIHDKHTDGTDISLTELQMLDLETFGYNMLDVLYLHSNRFAFKDASLIKPGNKQTKEEIFNQISQTDKIKQIIFDYCEEKALGYDDLRNGKKCYSEILAFEVVKYGLVDGVKTRLQNFFIPCHSELGKRLVDTQVFYDKEYIYEVFSISLVVGSEYTSELAVEDQEPQVDENFVEEDLIDPNYDNSKFGIPVDNIKLIEPPGVIAMPGPSSDQPILAGGPEYKATQKANFSSCSLFQYTFNNWRQGPEKDNNHR